MSKQLARHSNALIANFCLSLTISLSPCSLNLLSDDPVELLGTPLNSLSSHFQGLLKMEPGDRDAIFLHTTIGIEWSDKTKVRIKTRVFTVT